MSKSKVVWGAVGAMKAVANGSEEVNVTSVTIPDVEIPTQEIKGAGILGSYNLPMPGQVNAMSTSITVRAAGANKKHFISSEVDLEIRFATNCRANDGTLFIAGTKIFMKGLLTKISGGKGEVGSTRDETFEYSVVRYREIVDGIETLLVDQVAGVFRVGGKDLLADVRKALG